MTRSSPRPGRNVKWWCIAVPFRPATDIVTRWSTSSSPARSRISRRVAAIASASGWSVQVRYTSATESACHVALLALAGASPSSSPGDSSATFSRVAGSSSKSVAAAISRKRSPSRSYRAVKNECPATSTVRASLAPRLP